MQQLFCHKMAILLQNATKHILQKCVTLFLLKNVANLFKNVTIVTKCVGFITKCESYYKMRGLIQ